MNTIVYLKGNEETALQIALERNNNNRNYKKENVIKATKDLSKAKLRYNIKNGITYLRNEWIAKPVNKKDIENYNNLDEVIEWQFVNEIMNGASRLERGLKSIG